MSREEEIIQAADECYPTWEEHNAGFYQGAEWADQHPREGLWDSEKVIAWLQDNADSYTWYNEFNGESGMMDEFFEDLREAMDEKE